MTTEDQPESDALDDLDTDVVEDLEVGDDAADIRGGPALTTGHCPARQ